MDVGEVLDAAEVVPQGLQHRAGLADARGADDHAEHPEAPPEQTVVPAGAAGRRTAD
ncbi:hypothetical protein ACFWH0_00530 [Streptomyces coeruleorubidus]|uniref:hypothetical protein n=1 Tax=Streptomyces coeruleorubidus TaxID=116188 RepID=UPI00364CD501